MVRLQYAQPPPYLEAHVYGMRTAGGRYAKVELLAYYCKVVGTACLTFRYAYQGDGTRRVAPADR